MGDEKECSMILSCLFLVNYRFISFDEEYIKRNKSVICKPRVIFFVLTFFDIIKDDFSNAVIWMILILGFSILSSFF